MSSTPRIPKAEITGVYGTVLKKMSKKMVGEVPEALGVMWHNRAVLKVSMGLGQKATKWNKCDKDLKSYAHMAVASLIGCSFCLDLGYFQAHNEGLDEAKAPRGAALAGIGRLHAAGARRDGVRRGDVTDAADRAWTQTQFKPWASRHPLALDFVGFALGIGLPLTKLTSHVGFLLDFAAR